MTDDLKPDPIHDDDEREEAKARIAEWPDTASEDQPAVNGDITDPTLQEDAS